MKIKGSTLLNLRPLNTAFFHIFYFFFNNFTRSVIIFGIDNSSSSHADNRKKNVLVLGESPTYGINESFGSPEKKFSINFSKGNTKFCLSL